MRSNKDTSTRHAQITYFNLEILASNPKTKIWLGDDGGSLVSMSAGKLVIGLLPGNYNVEFGLGSANYSICVDSDITTTQQRLDAGPSCPRPVFEFKP